MKHIRTFTYKGETFEVIKDGDNYYWAFNEKFIDENGRLTKEFNGITGHRNDNLKDTLCAVMTDVDVDEWDRLNPTEDKMCIERILAIKDIVEANMAKDIH